MRVVVRADSSPQIGTGHLIRCRTLANELRDRGAEVQFICRAHPGHAAAAVKEEGFPILTLPPPRAADLRGYEAWLGVPQQQDADETLNILGEDDPDLIIVDHYALDDAWERAVRRKATRILAIDDLANRRHDCEIVLDQNYGADRPGRYDALVPANCLRLLGPRYALLRKEYRAQEARLRGTVERVLVSFGGTDIDNATGLTLEALSAPELSHLIVDIVVGAAYPHRALLSALAERRGQVTIHGPRPHLADLMAAADLSIGAGGGTTWERMGLGLPAVAISIADNQVPACEALAAAGLIDYAGPLTSLTADGVRRRIVALLNDRGSLLSLSEKGPLVVDGFGALRAAELLMPTDRSALRLRRARRSDAGVYFGWANEPEVRKQSLNSAPIAWETHLAWFQERIASDRSYLFTLEAWGGLPVGQIRFDRRDDGAVRLSYLLDPIVRGRGWASTLVAEGMRGLKDLGSFEVFAEVKHSNAASRAVFEKLGFVAEDLAGQGIRIYRAHSADF